MQLDDGYSKSQGLSEKASSMLNIAIAATLDRPGDLVLALERGRRTGISDAEIGDILGEVMSHADADVAESIRAALLALPEPD
jgi:alkylhydroperoxidase/carboxymuconolactone decarboxylase family protein YurZ